MSSLFGPNNKKKSKKKLKLSIEEEEKSNTTATTTTTVSSSDPNPQQDNVSSSSSLEYETFTPSTNNHLTSFSDLGLSPQLVSSCRELGFKKPTSVQRAIIPTILNTNKNVLALASTGSGKTAAYTLPILHKLSQDPYGIYCLILTPTRELAKQVNEQVLALGHTLKIKTSLVIGGQDQTKQSCELSRLPHFCIGTPGRIAELLRGPSLSRPRFGNVRFFVLDEADRLLTSTTNNNNTSSCGFENDMAEILLAVHGNKQQTDNNNDTSTSSESVWRRKNCQTLFLSATMNSSLDAMARIASGGNQNNTTTKNKLHKIIVTEEEINDDDDDDESKSSTDSEKDTNKDIKTMERLTTPKIPAGLTQEYIFMPSRVRDTYLIATIRNLMYKGGRSKADIEQDRKNKKKKNKNGKNRNAHGHNNKNKSRKRGRNQYENDSDSDLDEDDNTNQKTRKAKSAIIFVSTCERCGYISQLLSELNVDCIPLHSLLSQNRRLASLGKFKSQLTRILVATDVASRGLDIPHVDLVINLELPRKPSDYIHRVGRTARAGKRGLALNFVSENDVALVKACEKASGREMVKNEYVHEEMAISYMGTCVKAGRLAKMKLMEVGFDELVKKQRLMKKRDRRERVKRAQRAEKKL